MAYEEIIPTFDGNPKTAERIRRILDGRELKSDFENLTKDEAIEIIMLRDGCDPSTARMIYFAERDGKFSDVVEY